jgi:hypothetical protein
MILTREGYENAALVFSLMGKILLDGKPIGTWGMTQGGIKARLAVEGMPAEIVRPDKWGTMQEVAKAVPDSLLTAQRQPTGIRRGL